LADSESISSQLLDEMMAPGTPESLEALMQTMTPEIHARLKEAVALRRWPDSSRLSSAQLENAMQLIILYEHKNLPPDQHTGQKLTDSCSSSAVVAEPLSIKMNTAGTFDQGSENSGS
jgi:uncharacterized protein YeaC (DUF1315 family)